MSHDQASWPLAVFFVLLSRFFGNVRFGLSRSAPTLRSVHPIQLSRASFVLRGHPASALVARFWLRV